MTAFHLLPTRTGNAAENMAADFLLLQRYPLPEAVRFRHYDWRGPAVTFGYSQSHADVASSYLDTEVVRRPTGGGIVDHANDWTYCLVIPREHTFYGHPAPLTYQLIHEGLLSALVLQNVGASLQPAGTEPRRLAESCFHQAEPHDVILLSNGRKVAGAALKRNKNGLLLQGSIERGRLPELDWIRLERDFPQLLAKTLSAELGDQPWPEFDPDEETQLVEQFSSPEWNERR
jgi:lipoyl(octanoyl) transferase